MARRESWERTLRVFTGLWSSKAGIVNFPPKFRYLCQQLGAAGRPVIVCGTEVTRLTTPAFAADCVRLFQSAGKQAGLFYILPGASSFSSALLSSGGAPGQGRRQGETFADVIGDIEEGVVRGLVVVESDPFHYYPDSRRLEQALAKLELLIVIDYFPTRTVKCASVFYPASTIFETGATYVNQEGRVQLSERVHLGGRPIWGGGEHPPHVYRDHIPGGDHLPAWKTLQEIAGTTAPVSGPGDVFPGDLIAAEHRAFEGLKNARRPVDGMKILPGKSGLEWSSRPGAGKPVEGEGLELLTVDWMFGASGVSAWSDSLEASLSEPYMSMNSKDAQLVGVSDGDLVSVELDWGAIEIRVAVSDRSAEGVLILPRCQPLDWRKMKDFSVRGPTGQDPSGKMNFLLKFLDVGHDSLLCEHFDFWACLASP